MSDENKEKAILKITDNRVHNLKVKTKNGKLNIYDDTKKKILEELMNLQWRCYVSATKKYDKMSDLQKAMEIRVKLNVKTTRKQRTLLKSAGLIHTAIKCRK